ncbi:hypothetical protein NL676_030378 [Syzygium grande]|nr:hypothetical protein NL676_030378 [Syzygium grande]
MLDKCSGAHWSYQIQREVRHGKVDHPTTVTVLRGNISAEKFDMPEQRSNDLRHRFSTCGRAWSPPSRILEEVLTESPQLSARSESTQSSSNSFKDVSTYGRSLL